MAVDSVHLWRPDILRRVPVVTWWTRKQKSISHSSAEAEYFAASMASREGLYIRDLLEDLGLVEKGPTPLMLDSKGAISRGYQPYGGPCGLQEDQAHSACRL